MFRAFLHQGHSKRKTKNMAIQSSQMYRHRSRKIVLLHALSRSVVSLRRHVDILGNGGIGFSHKDLGSTRVTEKVAAVIYAACAPAL